MLKVAGLNISTLDSVGSIFKIPNKNALKKVAIPKIKYNTSIDEIYFGKLQYIKLIMQTWSLMS
jgi:hypothetical protein